MQEVAWATDRVEGQPKAVACGGRSGVGVRRLQIEQSGDIERVMRRN